MSAGTTDDRELNVLLPLPEEKRSELSPEIQQQLIQALSARSKLDADLKTWNNSFEQVIQERDWPFKGALNLNFPLTTDKIFSAVTRTVPMYFGNNPFFSVRGLDAESEKKAHEVEGWLDHEMRDRKRSLNIKAFHAAYLSFRDGDGWLAQAYQEMIRRRRIYYNGTNADGKPVKRSRIEDKTDFSGVNHDYVPQKDLYLMPAIPEGNSLRGAFGVARRFPMYGKVIERMIKRGIYYPEAKTVLAGSPMYTLDDESAQKVSKLNAFYHPLYNYYELFEIIMPIPYRGIDDIVEDVMYRIVYDNQANIICRIEEYPYSNLDEQFYPFVSLPRPNSPYGFSLPDILRYLQGGMNAINNQHLNAGELSVAPTIFYKPSAFKIQKYPWGPGKFIPTYDLEGYRIEKLPDPSMVAFEIQQNFMMWADKLSGNYDLSALAKGSSRNTKAQIQGMSAENALRSDMAAFFQKRTLSALAHNHLQMEIDWGPDSIRFKGKDETGNVQFVDLPKETLSGEFEIEIGNQLRGFDEQQKEQTELFVHEILSKDPNVIGAMPAFPPKFVRLRENTGQLLMSLGMKNIDARIGTKEEAIERDKVVEQMMKQGMNAMPPGGAAAMGNATSAAAGAMGGPG